MQNNGLAKTLHLFASNAGAPSSANTQQKSPTRIPGGSRSLSQIETLHRHPGFPEWLADANAMQELEVTFDANSRVLWQFMAPEGRPSFTEGLLREMTGALNMVEQAFAHATSDNPEPIRYLVLASHLPGVFNLGGNLALFQELIESQDWARLRHYAHVCARGQFRRADHLGLPVTTIALVQGDALGGGFEAALAHDVIIAERQAKFGLPEVLFNLFPGMGAYSFLSRRMDAARAERLILSGRVYDAEEMHAMGVVDHLAENGEGFDAVHECISNTDRQWRSRQAVQKARKIVQPLTLEEMVDIADVWVEAAMSLETSDIRRMQHLAKAQDRRWSRMWT